MVDDLNTHIRYNTHLPKKVLTFLNTNPNSSLSDFLIVYFCYIQKGKECTLGSLLRTTKLYFTTQNITTDDIKEVIVKFRNTRVGSNLLDLVQSDDTHYIRQGLTCTKITNDIVLRAIKDFNNNKKDGSKGTALDIKINDEKVLKAYIDIKDECMLLYDSDTERTYRFLSKVHKDFRCPVQSLGHFLAVPSIRTRLSEFSSIFPSCIAVSSSGQAHIRVSQEYWLEWETALLLIQKYKKKSEQFKNTKNSAIDAGFGF